MIAAILFGLLLSAQEPRESGVTPPQLTFKVEPEFSAEARSAGVQGTVVLDLVVSSLGRAENIQVVSPLGFGLDEKAIAAISRWKFRPAEKDGKPVNAAATVEVNFRFVGQHFDSKLEQRRAAYNRAVSTLSGKTQGRTEQAVKSLTVLVEKKFPPAIYAMGVLLQQGTHVPRDADKALAMFRESAAKHHGPSMYEIGKRTLAGSDGFAKG